MSDWHYHANHVDAPARGSQRAAEKDARAFRLHAKLYSDDRTGWLVDPNDPTTLTTLVVKCFRSDCVIQPKEVAALRER